MPLCIVSGAVHIFICCIFLYDFLSMLLLEYDDGLVSFMPHEIIAMQNDQVFSWTIYILSVQDSIF